MPLGRPHGPTVPAVGTPRLPRHGHGSGVAPGQGASRTPVHLPRRCRAVWGCHPSDAVTIVTAGGEVTIAPEVTT